MRRGILEKDKQLQVMQLSREEIVDVVSALGEEFGRRNFARGQAREGR